MASYKTPGVYVEEISTLPPSVAQVATAIPAFIGCTVNGPSADDGTVEPKIARVSSMLEFESIFGKANPSSFTVKTQAVEDQENVSEIVSVNRNAPNFDYMLYYGMNMFFSNGGGACYVVSVGNFSSSPGKQQFLGGLAAVEKEDEPTLLVFTEATNLSSADYYAVCQEALKQCNKLGDRFAILDVLDAEGDGANLGKDFRDNIGTNYLKYGAAYYPSLNTALNFQYDENDVSIESSESSGDAVWEKAFDDKTSGGNGVVISFSGAEGDTPEVKIIGGTSGDDVTFEFSDRQLTVRNASGKTGAQVVAAWSNVTDGQGFDVSPGGDGSGELNHTNNAFVALEEQSGAASSETLASIRDTNTSLYNQIKAALTSQRVTMPPSATVAGVYASVDNNRGVWKAPANVSLASVIGPTQKITHEQQENLNIDPTAGKSINAIRAFAGKGTLVWGARTLAGNDNEWRYISVRRLFNMIEESTKKSTSFAVFEPNDATTWLKVKAMVESYLYGLWEQGALAGSTPEAAYFVNVGLGKTMTQQDVLEGRMIVETGVAAVRPAEFIILRFMHKLQEA